MKRQTSTASSTQRCTPSFSTPVSARRSKRTCRGKPNSSCSYDQFRRRVEAIVDMPDRTIDLLFRFLHQNGGQLSKRAREQEFAQLTEAEAAAAEDAYKMAFATLERRNPMKTLLLFVLLSTATIHAQNEGLWEGYDGEWSHVSRQLLALAEATPAEKFAWRPAPGVRSIGEVYMHIAIANFYLLSVTGAKEPEVKVEHGKDRDHQGRRHRLVEALPRCGQPPLAPS